MSIMPSNGLEIIEKFLRDNAAFIDVLAISCTYFNIEPNISSS
jgi:hypothetical protein